MFLVVVVVRGGLVCIMAAALGREFGPQPAGVRYGARLGCCGMGGGGRKGGGGGRGSSGGGSGTVVV